MVVESSSNEDHRGAFTRLFCRDELQECVGTRNILQVNQSSTHTIGATRGLHYQNPPHAEMKLVRCLKGKVWDVAVDLRSGSSTFLQWFAVELSPEGKNMIVIPEGFAHGFQVLERDSELLYLHTAFYSPEAEAGTAYYDPLLAITWPLPVTDISDRDQQLPKIPTNFSGLNI